MKYDAFFGWGIVIYAIMFLCWSGFALYGFSASPWSSVVQFVLLIVVTTVAARSLRLTTWQDMLLHSLSWVAVIALLDAIFTVPFSGWAIYSDWRVWLGYALVALVPILSVRWHSA